ncbi:MAG: DUF4198 domain-containing protein [Candidatus Latescibacterota bacterium]
MHGKSRFAIACGAIVLLMTATAWAHFGAIIPSDDMVSRHDERTVRLSVRFFHPFEGPYMEMAKPAQFGVIIRGDKQDLLSALSPRNENGVTTWIVDYPVKRPGDHLFYMVPQPYFEPAEEIFVVHYTKVIVNAYGLSDGWDQEVGLRTEIVPLTRPYGIWSGNVFQGVVLVNGKPAPGTIVEVEYDNHEAKIQAPADPFVTQVVKADANGVFTYAMPRAGWWGFAALSTDEKKRKYTDGKEYDVEIGAVLWVKTYDMK